MRYEADIYARYGGHRGFASGLAQASDPARPAPLLASEDARSSFFPPIDGVETNEGRSRGGWPKASRVGFSETEVALHPARRSLRSRCATPGSSLAIDPTKIGEDEDYRCGRTVRNHSKIRLCRHCERKRSNPWSNGKVDCFIAFAPRNDAADCTGTHLSLLRDKHPHLRDLAARCASFAAREAI